MNDGSREQLPANSEPAPARLVIRDRRRTAAVLEIPLDDWTTLSLRLNGRHIRALLALKRSEGTKGSAFPELTAEDLAAIFYNRQELAAAPDAQTIRAYLSQLKKLIRAATPRGQQPPRLFASARFLGYRLVRPLQVTYIRPELP